MRTVRGAHHVSAARLHQETTVASAQLRFGGHFGQFVRFDRICHARRWQRRVDGPLPLVLKENPMFVRNLCALLAP